MSDIDTSPTTHDPKVMRTTLENPRISNVPAQRAGGSIARGSPHGTWLVRQMRHAFRIYKDIVLPNRYVTRRFIRSVAGSFGAQTCVDVGAGTCPFQRDLERSV